MYVYGMLGTWRARALRETLLALFRTSVFCAASKLGGVDLSVGISTGMTTKENKNKMARGPPAHPL